MERGAIAEDTEVHVARFAPGNERGWCELRIASRAGDAHMQDGRRAFLHDGGGGRDRRLYRTDAALERSPGPMGWKGEFPGGRGNDQDARGGGHGGNVAGSGRESGGARGSA